MGMICQKDMFIVSIPDSIERPEIFGTNRFIIDTDYNPKEHKKQIGQIVHLPIRITEQYVYDNPLVVGDEVLISHQVAEDVNKLEDGLYRADYYNIFAKINGGVLEPLEDFIFCDRVLDQKSNALLLTDKVSTKCAKVIAVCKNSKGVKVGDMIHFTSNADYTLYIGKKEFTRMRLRNVIAIERCGEIFPLSSKVMVMEVIVPTVIGGIELPNPNPMQKKGVVITPNFGLNRGDVVCYFEGHSSQVKIDGDKYSSVGEDNIKFVYK